MSLNMKKLHPLFWLAIILVFSLAVKTVVLFRAVQVGGVAPFFTNDTTSYIDSARALLKTGTFSVSPDNLNPQTIRTPGYPVFLALIYGIFGQNEVAAIFIQSLFSLGTIAIVYWIGSKLWNVRIGLAAALLLALDMNSAGTALLLLTETLFTFFLIAFLAVAVQFIHENESTGRNAKALILRGLGGGLLLAISIQIRPIGYYLGFFLLVTGIAWGLVKKTSRRSILTVSAAYILPLLIIIGGWQVRNYLETGSSQFSAIESINMINYRASTIVAEQEGITREAAIARITAQYGLNQEAGWNETWRKVGLKIILENPVLFLKQFAKGILNTFLGPGSETIAQLAGTTLGNTSPLGDIMRLSFREYATQWVEGHPYYFSVFVFSVLHMLLLYAGFLLGVINSIFKRGLNAEQGVLLLTLLYLVVVSAGPEAYYRFRVPMTPILALLAAAGWMQILKLKPGALGSKVNS
jgi:4-amino-4-deoxy-L-arabinose transferase-like glycosyltransferase